MNFYLAFTALAHERLAEVTRLEGRCTQGEWLAEWLDSGGKDGIYLLGGPC